MQNKAAQIVCHAPPRAHRKDMFDKLGWLTVNQLICYHTLISVFKIRSSGEPEYLAKALKYDNRFGRVIIPNTDLGLAKKSFTFRGSLQWNLLPTSLRNTVKISQFKKDLRKWVQANIPRFLE